MDDTGGGQPLAQLVIDEHRHIADVMASSVELAPWVGRSLVELIEPDDRDRVVMATREARGRGKCSVHARWLPDGTPHPVRLHMAQGQRWLVATVDEVGRASRGDSHLASLGMVASQVSHDLKNLLGVILVNAELITRSDDDLRLIGEAASDIVEATGRARELSEQVLTYADPRAAAVEPYDLAGLVRSMQRLVEACTSSAAVVRFQVEDEHLPLRGRSVRMRQLIMNLVINAAEAIGDSVGTVVVHTGRVEATPQMLARTHSSRVPDPGTYACLTVEDTGPGMDSATVAHIFEPFFSTKATGHGVGLAAVVEVVDEHGGALLVDSSLGHGTTFRVLLPLSSDTVPVAGPPVRRAMVPELFGRTVLMVDDDELLCAVTKRVLRGHGAEVLVATNGLDGVELFTEERHRIDCVLLDMALPSVSGSDVFAELRRIDPSIAVVVASGLPKDQLRSNAAVVGANGLLLKPFQEAHLVEALALLFGDAPED